MRDSTTIRVSPATRDGLRELAETDGLTLGEVLTRLLRAERQRRMGQALAAELSDDERAWLDAGAATVRDHAGG
jgi:predicted transcriptional regulator